MRHTRRHRWLRWLSIFAVAGLVLAACGGDDDDDDGVAADDTEDDAGDEEEADKSPLKLGVIAALSTNGVPAENEGLHTIRAWADQVNDAGGIDGHPVEIVHKDDAGDTAKALQLMKELAAEGVHAITQTNAAMLTVLRDEVKASADLFILCGAPYQKVFEEEPRYFHCGGTNSTGVYGQVGVAFAMGAKHFQNMYCAEIAACGESAVVTAQAAKDFGIQHSTQSAPLNGTDYTAQCLKAKQDGVDYLQVNGSTIGNVVRDCARQNYHPTFGLVSTSQNFIDAVAGGEKGAGNLWDFPAFYTGPEARDFQRAVATFKDKIPAAGATATQLWKTGKMFEVVAEIALEKTDNPTRADFLEALYSVKDETLGGLAPPITYGPKGQPNPKGRCWYGFLSEGGKLIAIDADGKPATKLTPICKTTAAS